VILCAFSVLVAIKPPIIVHNFLPLGDPKLH